MPKIVLDDIKTVYDLLEIEIGGETYRAKEPNIDEWQEIEGLEAQMKAGTIGIWQCIRRQLQIFFPDSEFVGKLDRNQAQRLMKNLWDAITKTGEKEKNGPGPGAVS